MRTLVTVLLTLFFSTLAIVGIALSGVYDVSAASPHTGVARWLLSATSRASIERHARHLEVPDLTSADLTLAGVSDYEAMCASCHGAPGREPAAIGQGLNPPAPDLTETVQKRTAAELFWVTRNGIRMTGMPAWGASHDDEALWPVVAFLTALPDLDAAGYRSLLEESKGLGHHGPDATDEPASTAESPDKHDHSAHKH